MRLDGGNARLVHLPLDVGVEGIHDLSGRRRYFGADPVSGDQRHCSHVRNDMSCEKLPSACLVRACRDIVCTTHFVPRFPYRERVGTKARLLVVALGGNAIQRADDDSVESDFVHTAETAERLASFLETSGDRLVVTHGNGPQVGNHLLRSQLGHDHGDLPLLPLDVCVADTQGGMGYMLQQTLTNAFAKRQLPAVVASVVTQIVVDADDPAFENPTKPVGETISEDRADEFRARGWTLAPDARRGGYRRVVASA